MKPTQYVPTDCPRANKGSEKLSPRCCRAILLSPFSFSLREKIRLVAKLKDLFPRGRHEARIILILNIEQTKFAYDI